MYNDISLGVDVARFGDDESSIAMVDGRALIDIKTYSGKSTTETASIVATLIDDYNIMGNMVVIDTVGLGAGVADTLTNMQLNPSEFIAGAKPVQDDIQKDSFFTFNNVRSQAWWHLRTLLQNGRIAFDIDTNTREAQKLRDDLTAPRYRVKGEKQLEVEPKTGTRNWGIKNRLGRSTDVGDSIVQAYFAERLTPSVDYSRVF